MDDRVLNPDDAKERIAAWKGRIDQLAADTKTMSDRFQQLQVTRKDRDGLVEVTVDSSGSLLALKLSREIDRSSPDVLAATIMSTIRDAKSDLADRSQEIIAETMGTESPAARAIAERVGQHLRGQPAEQAAPRPRARDDEDDDNNDPNIWR
ncbi:YbaB/EbfC family nucleoid-associated protein [Actinophytocola sp.]|uniref:YbaB/EbfC family nucleoid-associated protein n=1 Tax=Actinophytocola sp. TaxID=1872138 RepID=UPI002ED3D056